MQGDASEQPPFSVERAEPVAQHAEADAGEEDVLQPPAREHAGEAEHGDDFGDLAERHPRGGVREPELREVRGRVGVVCSERDIVERGGDEDDEVVAVAQEQEGVEAEALLPCEVLGGRGRRDHRQGETKREHKHPRDGAAIAGERGTVGIQQRDDDAAEHPADGRHRADGAELPPRIAETREDDGRRDAPCGRGKKRVQQDEPEHGERGRVEFDRGRRGAHRAAGGEREPAQELHGCHALVGDRAKDERRDERGNSTRRKRERLHTDRCAKDADIGVAVAIEYGAERHEPHAHRHPVDEEQRQKFGVLAPPFRFVHAARDAWSGGGWQACVGKVLSAQFSVLRKSALHLFSESVCRRPQVALKNRVQAHALSTGN